MSLRRQFISSQILVAVGFMTMNLGNYLTSVLAARRLSPETFSTFVSLTSLASIVTTIGSLAQPVIATHVASTPTDDAQVFAGLTAHLAMMCLGIGLGWIALSPVIMHVYKFDDPSILLLLGAYVLAATLLPALVGFAQGSFRYRTFALAFAIGGIARPLAFVAVTSRSTSIRAALFALVSSLLLTILALISGLPHAKTVARRLVQPKAFRINSRLVRSGVCLTCVSVLTYGDVITARVKLDEVNAAAFASAALLTNVMIYGAFILVSVLVPFVARARDNDDQPKMIARWSIGFLLLFGTVYAAALRLFGERILRLTFGDRYQASGTFLALYGLVFMGVGLVALVMNYEVAQGRRTPLAYAAFAATCVFGTALTLFGTSRGALVVCDLVGVAFVLGVSGFSKDSLIRVALKRRAAPGNSTNFASR